MTKLMPTQAGTRLPAAVLLGGMTALGVAVAPTTSSAATIQQLVTAHPNFQFEDDSAEGLGVDEGQQGVLEPGDTLRGIATFQAFRSLTDASFNVPLNGVDNSALNAIFEIEVDTVTPTTGGNANFTFVPHADFVSRNGLADGSMVALYEGDTPVNPFACPSVDACEGGVTSGTHILSLGFSDDQPNEWTADNLPADLTTLANSPVTESVGFYNFQLAVLENALGVPFAPITIGDAGPADAFGSGSVKGILGNDNQPVTTVYSSIDDTDIQLSAVPVPAALPLFLAAVAGLGLVGWRRS